MKRFIPVIALLLLLGCLQPDAPPTPPVDPPSPAPVESGLKVQILYESSTEEFQKLPPSQIIMLQSAKLRKRLGELNADWRIWDKDTDVTRESEFWQKAIKLPYESLPWIWVTNGSKGVNGKAPLTEAETIELIERYAK